MDEFEEMEEIGPSGGGTTRPSLALVAKLHDSAWPLTNEETIPDNGTLQS